MLSISNLKELSFLVYGLGITGQSVVKFFKKNKIKKFTVWDDKEKKLFLNNRATNLNEVLNKVDYIILSPGISDIKKKKQELLLFYELLEHKIRFFILFSISLPLPSPAFACCKYNFHTFLSSCSSNI